MTEAETSIQGIPCIARMTSYYAGRPATHLEPEEPMEVEYEVLTSAGKPAGNWLMKKITELDEERIVNDLLDAKKAEDEYWSEP